MKKLTSALSIVFIVLLFFISSRFVVFTSFVKSQKKEFRQQILAFNSAKTKHLLIAEDRIYKNEKGLEWAEHNKELIINGNYYEVISVIKTSMGYAVTLIEDKQENELFKNYFHLNKLAKNSLKDHCPLFFGFNFIETPLELLPKPFYKGHFYHSPPFLFDQNSFKNRLNKPPGLFPMA